MPIRYDEARLHDALTDFYNATGISIQLIRPDFSHFGESVGVYNRYCRIIQESEAGRGRCYASDRMLLVRCRETKQMQLHVCHAGLVDIAVPLLYGDEILGYIILGQLKREASFEEVRHLTEGLSLDPSRLEACYDAWDVYDGDRVRSVARIAEMLAKYILLEHLLTPDSNRVTDRAAAYIDAHLDGPISIRSLSAGIHVSKSALYQHFHDVFSCTVSEYVNARRVERASELLRTTSLSVEEISVRVGFSSAAYFSKIFKKHRGMSPLRYRNIEKRG